MNKISTRFAVMMAAAAVVPLLAYGAVSFLSVRGGAQQAVIQGNQNVATRAGEQIERYVLDSIRILNTAAQNMHRTDLTYLQQDRILKNYASEFDEFQELTLLDENGNALASSSLVMTAPPLPGPDSPKIEGALISRFSIDNHLLPT